VLMFPMDISNRKSCSHLIDLSECNLTMPMRKLWYAVWLSMGILAFIILPFALFFYEGDSEWSAGKKFGSALMWTLATSVVVLLIIIIPYTTVAYAQYPFQALASGTANIGVFNLGASVSDGCVPPYWFGAYDLGGGTDCNPNLLGLPEGTWTQRVQFPVYLVAIMSILGWCLMSVFAAVGSLALPIDWLLDFADRPKKVITKSEYINKARQIARRAKKLRDIATSLKREEMATGKTRKWRRQAGELNKQVNLIVKDEETLSKSFPQGEQREALWILITLGYYVKLLGGLVGGAISIIWLIHMIVYLFIKPPASPFLNQFFIAFQNAWGLLGVLVFGAFCLYLVAMTVHGLFRLGFFVGVMAIHPMKVGKTFMSTFLFNCILVMIISPAVVQFCAWAFAMYAEGTTVQDIFLGEVQNLRGFRPLYSKSIFQYIYVASLLLGALWLGLTMGGKSKAKGEIQ